MLMGTPPGTYWLEASAFRSDTDLSLMPNGVETAVDPAWARVGQIEVTPGKWRLIEENAQVDTFSPTLMKTVPLLTLMGWTVPDVIWRPGELAQVDLLWQGDEAVFDKQMTADLWLVNENGDMVAETAVIVGNPGAENVVRDIISWRLPPGLETGLHTVMLSFGGQTVELGQWQIDAPERTFEPPEVDIISDFAVDFAKLVGYSLANENYSPR